MDLSMNVESLPLLTGEWEERLPNHLKSTLYWHPFQLPEFLRVWKALRNSMARDMTLRGPEACGAFCSTLTRLANEWLLDLAKEHSSLSTERLLALLLTIGPVVHPMVHGNVRYGMGESYGGYFAWRDTIDLISLPKRFGFELEELRDHHRDLSLSAHLLDPLSEFRALFMQMSRNRRKKLKGECLAAHDLYDIAETLRRYGEYIDGKEWPEEDDHIWPEDSQRVKREFFGDSRISHPSRQSLWRIVRHYGLDPQVRATWFLEGETEESFFRRLAELEGVDLDRNGLVLFNLGGKDTYEHPVVRHLFEQHQASGSFVLMSLDRDRQGGAKHIDDLKRFERKGWLTASYKIWEPDFESENFSASDLAAASSRLASEHGVDLVIEEHEISEMMKQRGQPAGKVLETLLKRNQVYSGKGSEWGRCLAELAHERGLAKPAIDLFADFFRHSYFDYDASVEAMDEKHSRT